MAKEAKRGKKYGTVILDPPTFARAGKCVFSTEKNLVEVHRFALSLVARSGCLVMAINLASVTRLRFRAAVMGAFKEENRESRVLHTIELPKTFSEKCEGYLKGFCFEVI
jgi:23S rRNA (cytosine1962-C5)-methyltransferase